MTRHNQQNYEPGYDFDELWHYNILSGSWKFLPQPAGAPSPGKRYLAGLTAVGDMLLLYGGMQDGQGDVWAYHLRDEAWELLLAERPAGPDSPGRRMGHSIMPFVTPGAHGFLLYGGRTVGTTDALAATIHSDVWFFDVARRAWRQVRVDGEAPPGRTYHVLTHAAVPCLEKSLLGAKQVMHVGLAVGGTTTTPSLTCAADAWLLAVDCEGRVATWKKLPDIPVPLYDLAGAAYGKDAFVYGGHLCSLDDTQHYPYYYTNLAVHLDLSKHLPAASAGCVVDVAAADKLQYTRLASVTSTDL